MYVNWAAQVSSWLCLHTTSTSTCFHIGKNHRTLKSLKQIKLKLTFWDYCMSIVFFPLFDWSRKSNGKHSVTVEMIGELRNIDKGFVTSITVLLVLTLCFGLVKVDLTKNISCFTCWNKQTKNLWKIGVILSEDLKPVLEQVLKTQEMPCTENKNPSR